MTDTQVEVAEQVVEPGEPAAQLQVTQLSIRFRTAYGTLQAVDGVSFGLRAGRTLGVVGESGSGKSAMARSLMNLLAPNAELSGRILFEGRDVTALTKAELRDYRGREVAMVFQDPMTSLNPTLKIGSQLVDPLRRHFKMSRKEASARAVELLGEMGLTEPARRFDQYPHNLSGGMRQRVTIARALSCSPKLLIADEPTTALDVTIQRQILNLLQRLQQEHGMSMIVITHDLGVAATRTDEIIVMYAGQIVEQAPTAVLFGQMRHPYTRALVDSVPKITDPSQKRPQAITGRPPVVIEPGAGCRFAPRCPNAQPRCREETPPLVEQPGVPEHRYACFFPVDAPAVRPGSVGLPSDG